MAQIQTAFFSYLQLLAIVAGPFVVYALYIHFLERTIQKRLAERFGWNSVIWTGWLGTPIHELSHAAMCVLFGHRIDSMALFKPDLESGRLGYVRHSWRKNSWFEEIGNVFIGIAPLFGGSIVLLILLRLFFPIVFELAPATDSTASASTFLGNALSELFQPESVLSLRFWVFVYLVLCVASHMAPSREDYRGAVKGAVMVVIGLFAGLILVSVAVPNTQAIQSGTIELLTPLFTVLLVAALLCTVSTLIVSVTVSFFPQRFRVE